MRTPTKHSTNVDTAPSIVPVPTVVNRQSMSSPTSENILPSSIRGSPVRLVLNPPTSVAENVLSTQPQLATVPSSKAPANDQASERPVVIKTVVATPRRLDSDTKGGSGDTNTAQISSIAFIPQNKGSSSSVVPFVQNSEGQTLMRSSSLCQSLSSTASSNSQSSNNKFVPVTVSTDMTPRPSHNLVTTLRGSSLVSHSAIPIDTNQTTSLISVVPVDSSKCIYSGSTLSTSIRPSPRTAFPVAPSRPNYQAVVLNRSVLARQQIIGQVPQVVNSFSTSLAPSRKRARKQQLMAPQGGSDPSNSSSNLGPAASVVNYVEVVQSTSDNNVVKKILTGSNSVTSTPNIEAALQSSNPATQMAVNSNSAGTNHLVNFRFLPVRPALGTDNAQSNDLPLYEPVSISTTTVTTPSIQNLLVSSCPSSDSNSTEAQHACSTTSHFGGNSSSSSTAASLVTASSFPPACHASSQSQFQHQQSMYVFPSATVSVSAASLRTNASVTSTAPSNVVQVRFRPSTPTKSQTSNSSSSQIVRTIMSQPVVNNTAMHVAFQPPATSVSPPSRKSVASPTVMSKTQTPPNYSSTTECSSRNSNSSDVVGQPLVPIVRVPDPSSRVCFDGSGSSSATNSISPGKRSRKQSNSVSSSGIKKQCTWELRTDPTDSNRSIWRTPLERRDQQTKAPSSSSPALKQVTDAYDCEAASFGSEVVVTTPKLESESSVDHGCYVLHGMPKRRRIYEPIYLTQRLNSPTKSAKYLHFLRSSEVRIRGGSLHQTSSSVLSPSFRSFSTSGSTNSQRESGARRHTGECRDESLGESGTLFGENSDIKVLELILDLRERQAEQRFFFHTIDRDTYFDISGWRLKHCLKNCDQMISVEEEKLQRFEELSKRLSFLLNSEPDSRTLSKDIQILPNQNFNPDQHVTAHLLLQTVPPIIPIPDVNTISNVEILADVSLSESTSDRPRILQALTEPLEDMKQRMKSYMECLQKLNSLSQELILGHCDFVQRFITELEDIKCGGAVRTSIESPARSVCNDQKGDANVVSGSSSSDDEEEEGDVDSDGTNSTASSMNSNASPRRLAASPVRSRTASCRPPTGTPRRSTSPAARKGTARSNFHATRR